MEVNIADALGFLFSNMSDVKDFRWNSVTLGTYIHANAKEI